MRPPPPPSAPDNDNSDESGEDSQSGGQNNTLTGTNTGSTGSGVLGGSNNRRFYAVDCEIIGCVGVRGSATRYMTCVRCRISLPKVALSPPAFTSRFKARICRSMARCFCVAS